MSTSFQMFQNVDLTRREDNKLGIDPSTAGHKNFLRQVKEGTVGQVTPPKAEAAFKLIVPKSEKPPLISTGLTLKNYGNSQPVPLGLLAYTKPGGQKVDVDREAIIDLAEAELPKPEQRLLDLSIIGTLNTTALSSERSSLEFKVSCAVLRYALTSIRTRNEQGVFGKQVSPEEHRAAVNALDIRQVMSELQGHPDGFNSVRYGCEMFLKAQGGSEKVQAMRKVLSTLFKGASSVNPVLAGWLNPMLPETVAAAEASVTKIIQTVSGRPGALSFTAVSALLKTAKNAVEVQRAVNAIKVFSSGQARQAGQNPAEREAMKDVLAAISAVGDEGVKAAIRSGKISQRAAVVLSDDSKLCRELVEKVNHSKKQADQEAKRIGLDKPAEGSSQS